MYGIEFLIYFLYGIIIFFISIGILFFLGLWKVFKKCGYEGWKALIPFYNAWILIKISGLNSWYYLLLMANFVCSIFSLDALTPIGNIASLVASFFMFYNICKKFRMDMFFTVLTFLFSFIMIPIIGMKKDIVFDDSVEVSPNGPIGDSDFSNSNYNRTNTNNNNDNSYYCRYCGTKLDINAKYCRHCGNKVNED